MCFAAERLQWSLNGWGILWQPSGLSAADLRPESKSFSGKLECSRLAITKKGFSRTLKCSQRIALPGLHGLRAPGLQGSRAKRAHTVCKQRTYTLRVRNAHTHTDTHTHCTHTHTVRVRDAHTLRVRDAHTHTVCTQHCVHGARALCMRRTHTHCLHITQ